MNSETQNPSLQDHLERIELRFGVQATKWLLPYEVFEKLKSSNDYQMTGMMYKQMNWHSDFYIEMLLNLRGSTSTVEQAFINIDPQMMLVQQNSDIIWFEIYNKTTGRRLTREECLNLIRRTP